MKSRLLLPAALAMLCCACVTHIRTNVSENPPPREPLSAFQHFQLQPVVAANGKVSEQTDAMARISSNTRQKLGNTISRWENASQSGRTLTIEPRIMELKFVSGTKRFFAGDFAGSSAVIMHLRLTDAGTGQVIADPEFYQRAAAEGGTWTFGATDKGMLVRISTVAQQYLQRNYSHAVGGPTGLDSSEER
ncbi:MAG: hypothetical protein M3Y93_01590 [Pseudomonadota bacterium]|nr:hypothetical protein [Pseudomonadota bacterium]